MAKKQIFEITGIGFPNKGAELMLIAAAQQIRARYGPEAIVCCAPTNGTDVGYRCMSQHGIHLRAAMSFRGFEFGRQIANILPQKVLRMYGCIAEKEVSTVFDASGLKYSDSFGQIGVLSSKEQLKYYRRLKKRGGKLILLPQAFGPFENKELQNICRELFSLADLIFAREEVSYQYLVKLVGKQEKIQIAPDFTNLVKGVETERTKPFKGKIGIIPNNKMIWKKSAIEADEYIQSLLAIANLCQKNGHEIYLLNHEGIKDKEICEKLRQHLGEKTPYAEDLSALEIKATIGNSTGIVTSRFHGLVSALSQGIPSLATSWSHKYEELCSEYETSESLISSADLNQRTNLFLEKITQLGKDSRSCEKAEFFRRQSEALWPKVWEALDL